MLQNWIHEMLLNFFAFCNEFKILLYSNDSLQLQALSNFNLANIINILKQTNKNPSLP